MPSLWSSTNRIPSVGGLALGLGRRSWGWRRGCYRTSRVPWWRGWRRRVCPPWPCHGPWHKLDLGAGLLWDVLQTQCLRCLSRTGARRVVFALRGICLLAPLPFASALFHFFPPPPLVSVVLMVLLRCRLAHLRCLALLRWLLCLRVVGVLSRWRPCFFFDCLLYTSPSPRDGLLSRMPSSA